MDWLYLGVLAAFLAATVGFIAFCDRIGGGQR